ncbi:putative chemoreceptor glutamine deamidase CheD 1 [Candidatus Sulfotelmatobacter kueseliae]|uniref:Probable chemoreceptor glutamine deamidase CheD n=1 Tax=Candidatus Sulfotelmatobacter kueseliae TaxID=2042962 RepID=A0A2U3K591_9BACT|nr:putative chemoreceptor glutamine deamidase CheD 1 [Candidatus Sulfotelmatobacter kueseliae]
MTNSTPFLTQLDGTPSGLTSNAPALKGRQSVYLLPGEFHASAEPCQIRTILGSCVSICLWDVSHLAGGMNHFLLPASREGEPASLRFGDLATKALLEKVLRLGCRLPNLRAKIFGGGSMFLNSNRRAISLGEQNVAAALALMKNARIPVSVQETGGTHGRKVVFNTDDGTAWCRRIG